MAQHDSYAWLVLATSATGVISLAGAAFGFLRKTGADRRAQAEAFFVITIPDEQAPPGEISRYVAINGSDRIVSMVHILRRPGKSNDLGIVEPGRHEITSVRPGGMLSYRPVACVFQDAAGRQWARTDEGRLLGGIAYRWWLMGQRDRW